MTRPVNWFKLLLRFINHQQEIQGRMMHSHQHGLSGSPALPLAERRSNHITTSECRRCAKTNGEDEMETRVVELEARVVELGTHLKYIRRDMEEIRADVRSIKHRFAYAAGGTVVVIGLLGWIANSRFDQLVALLAR